MVSVNLNTRTWKHIFWLTAGMILVLALPLLILRLLKIQTDLYYLIFASVSIAFLYYYRKRSDLKIKASIKSGWALGLILAVFFGLGFVSYNLTINSNIAVSDINAAAVIWRGLVFGFISGIVLTAFPFITVWRSFAGKNPSRFRRFGLVTISAFAIFLMSLCHSIGYAGLDKEKMANQIKVNLVAGLPTLLSGNPMASPIAGTFLKVSETVLTADDSKIETVIHDQQTGGTN